MRRAHVKDAAARAEVTVRLPEREFTGTLLAVPIPASQRRPRVGGEPRRTYRGGKAIVLHRGRHERVPADTVWIDEATMAELDLDAALSAAEADREVLG